MIYQRFIRRSAWKGFLKIISRILDDGKGVEVG
jgi:hypothetical protein